MPAERESGKRWTLRPWGSRSVLVAKPKRRKFTAQYRLRILEEAESCTQLGRLLRREGRLPSDGMAQGAGVRGRFKA